MLSYQCLSDQCPVLLLSVSNIACNTKLSYQRPSYHCPVKHLSAHSMIDFSNACQNSVCPYQRVCALDMPSEKHFLRRGEVGDWKNFFDNDRNEKWNKWILENIKGSGFEELEYFK